MDQTLIMPLSDVYVDGKTYTREQLQRLGRNELRPIARSVHATLRSTVSLTLLGSAANAGDLRAFILRDKPDSEFGFASNGNGQAASDEGDAASLMTQAIQAIAASAKNGASKAELDEVRADLEEVDDWIHRKFTEVLNFAKHELEKNTRVTRIEVTDREPITVSGLRHKAYEDLLADILAFQATKQTNRANFSLVGPAGTGKTTAAEKIAEQLNLPFYFNGAIDSEYKLRGFIDAQGRVVATPFRRAYEHGGVYLFDEVDSSLPSACLAFNAALANGQYDFPGQDDPIVRSCNCIVLAASNTWGGPEGGNVGRLRQDAAFMDRFVRIPWETDEAFESELCSNKAWVSYVQSVRAKAIANGVEHLVSPRV